MECSVRHNSNSQTTVRPLHCSRLTLHLGRGGGKEKQFTVILRKDRCYSRIHQAKINISKLKLIPNHNKVIQLNHTMLISEVPN